MHCTRDIVPAEYDSVVVVGSMKSMKSLKSSRNAHRLHVMFSS